MLTLPIKKKWFDMILLGEKTEEYREIKPYWTTRFIKVFAFHNGMSTDHSGDHSSEWIWGKCSLYQGSLYFTGKDRESRMGSGA